MAAIQFSGDFAILFSKFVEVGSDPYYKTFGSTRAVLAEQNQNGVGALGIGAVFEGDLTPTVFTGTIDWFGSAWIGNTPNAPSLEYDFIVSGLSIASADVFASTASGAPRLVAEGLRSGLVGTDYVVNGSDSDDVFGPAQGFNLSGDDTIYGLSGDDKLSGGKGDDRIFGGGLRDQLFGNAGEDQLFGGRNKDDLSGGQGNDVLKGGKAPDRLVGGVGDDFLWGQKGSDSLRGGPGNDILSGGQGSDRFIFVVGKSSGDDMVTDFQRVADKLKFVGPITFDDLTIDQMISDTVISWDGGSVTLQGVTAQIDVGQFVFV